MLCKIWLKKSFTSNKGEVGIVLETAHIKMDKTGSPPLLANNVVSLEREGEPETTPLTIKN